MLSKVLRCACSDNGKVCECKKAHRLKDLNSAVREYKWIKAVVFDNIANYVLEK